MAQNSNQAQSSASPIGDRYEELKKMLLERQREIVNEVHSKINEVRDDRPADSAPRVLTEPMTPEEEAIQEDIEFAVIQMKAETLNKINEALARLEAGTYGLCIEPTCGREIRIQRLQALPFALRCRDCEDDRELAQQRERNRARKAASQKDE